MDRDYFDAKPACICDWGVPADTCPVHADRPIPKRTTPENPTPLPRARGGIIVAAAGVKAMNVDLSNVDIGQYVDLVPEPNNPHDVNAVKIVDHTDEDRLLGYIPRDIAARLWAGSDEPTHWRACIAEVLEFDGRPAGLRLRLTHQSFHQETV